MRLVPARLTSLKFAAALALLPALATGLPALPAHAADAAKTTATAQPPAIIATRAVEAMITDRVLANGTITAVEEILVAPQVEGLAIESLEADVGDRVEAGAVLATLADDQLILQRSQLDANRAKALAAIAQLEAQLAEVEANTAETVKAAARASELVKSGAFSTVQAEQAEAQATAAQARVRSMEQSVKVAQTEIALIDAQLKDVDLRLARTEVKAPVSGIVSARGARVGSIASGAAGPLFSIIRDGELELRVEVAESDMHRIAEGQPVLINLIGDPEARTARVRLIEPTLNITTRLGLARIEIEAPEGLRAGMFADAEIIVAERETVVVPVTSVNISAEGASVLKITNGTATRTRVMTGIREGALVEIAQGLAPGDLIVAKAGAFVRDGDRITPVEESENGRVAAISE